MKGRVNSMLWWLVGSNAVVLILVLCFSYGAGARSGGLRLRDFSILPQVAGFELLGAAFLVVAATIVLFVWLDTKFGRPLSELVDYSDKLAAGDVEAHASITPDDFGLIAENMNRTSEVLARTRSLEALNEALTTEIAEIENSFVQLGRGELNARARVAVDALGPLAQGFNVAAEALLRRLERVRNAAAEISGAANSCFVAAADSAGAVAEAEQHTAQVIPGIEELAARGRQACVDAEASAEASRRALAYADEGNRAVRETADGMQRLRSTMQTTAAKIKSLGDRSLQIYDIINIIHETNLLALNAVLSATRGSGGAQPLETLSSEMSRLADHSRESTREIVTLLKSIQSESNEAAVVIEEANRVAETGSRLSEQASRAFAGIASLLQQTADLATAIAVTSRHNVESFESTHESVRVLESQAQQNVTRTHEAASQAEQLTRLCEQLNQTLAQFRTGPAVVKPEPKSEIPAAAATSA